MTSFQRQTNWKNSGRAEREVSRNSLGADPSLCLGYFHRSDCRWLVFASSQLALQCFPMLSHMFLQFLYTHPVYSGRPSILEVLREDGRLLPRLGPLSRVYNS